ncbi:hypothetical protein LO772_03125 [Yinghuangia sp. ASG 101]|uniref:hypothetical protein n=1 Tax=Yinghuangia sp. ASG 101 TaxID=2896848 RepID=UPI001E317CFF|nr:hypothetical protein [Yinghuangia sp. ASG 101]UGQ12624.1 hypothetical protein LO772_03125 [Yinghuangia sp. ASG 101]
MSTKIRKAAAITLGAGLLATVVAASPALAAEGSLSGAGVGVVRTEQADVVHRVTAFWDQYKSAVLGTNPVMNPEEVRGEFLTAELNTELDAWAAEHGADPIFRAQNVPADRSVRYEGSGAGHASVVVTQYWGDGTSNDVWYRVPLDGSRFDGLQDPPA